MIKDSNIVEDIRRIRHKISAKFDYLQMCQDRGLRKKDKQSCSANKEIAPPIAATSKPLTQTPET